MGSPAQVRIFFSSPGDVKMERETARRIVDRLQGEVGDRMTIEPYFWEHEVMVATKDYQENIPEMDDFDIVVCVLWSRLGTPLHPNRHPRPGGGFFESGTEYEFFTAMQAHNVRGTPDIFVFRNGTEPRRPSRPKEAREAVDREVDRLDHFFERYFQEEQYFTGAVNVYSTLGEFEDKLTLALRSFIEGRYPQAAAKARRQARYEGLPYLGLSAFDFKDAPVFFGRTAQVGEVIEAFQTQELEAQANEGQGRRFVLIIGSSGSGKSSLARAGVLPMLVQPGVIEGTQSWRRAIFKPGDAGGDPFAALAAALMAPEALPELSSAGTTVAEMANLIRNEATAATILLRQSLSQAGTYARAEEERRLLDLARNFETNNREADAVALRQKAADLPPGIVRIALLADQLEELFTSGMAEEVIEAFIDRLATLATSGRVFVIGTLRSDFYPQVLEHPKLIELMKDRGTYALPAPTPGDIGQMIRQPATAAGLTFEENRGKGEHLDELLRDAAIKDPGALPLLSYTLEQLYERRTPEGMLTLAAYHDLGGLEGAIGRRAESVFASLPREAQAAFSQVWPQLVTLSEGSEPVRRRAPYQALTQSPGAPQLVDALIAARLLNSDTTPEGERTISVAHEALLRQWPRVIDWVKDNLDFLRARARMAARLAEWLEHDSSDDYLIPSGPPVLEAEGLLIKHGDALYPKETDYITRSVARARYREQARLRRARLVTTGALVLSALAVAGGIFAWTQSKAADRERIAAEKQKHAAEEAAAAAHASRVRSSYLLGLGKLETGQSREGLTNLAEALVLDPQHTGARDRLYSYHLYGLPKAIPIRSVLAPKHTRQRISGAKRGPKQNVVYLTDGKAVEIFDLNTRQVVPGPWEQEPDSFATVLSPDSAFVLNLRMNMEARIWNLGTGKVSAPLPNFKDFAQLIYTVDGATFLDANPIGEATFDNRQKNDIRVRNTEDGAEVYRWTQQGYIWGMNETIDGNIVTASGEELTLYNREEKKVTITRKDPDYYFNQVKAASESSVLAVLRMPRDAEKGLTMNIQFLDAATLEPIEGSRAINITSGIWEYQVNPAGTAVGLALTTYAAEIRHRDDETIDRVFELTSYSTRVCFTPDERLFLTATPDGTVRIFDTDSAKLAFEPISHDGRLEDMEISWDGRYLLTATAERARIWDLAVGPALSLPINHPDGIQASGPGAEQDHFWIASAKGLQEWDLREMKEIGQPLHHDKRVHDCLFDATGTQTALLWDKKNIRFARTDQPDAKDIPNWTAPDAIQFWSLSSDGKLFSATVGQEIHLIDPTTAKPIGQPWKVPSLPTDSLMARNDTLFAVALPNPVHASKQNEVRLWSVKESKEVPLAQAEASVSMLRTSKDGRWLAAAAAGVGQAFKAFAVLWDLESPTTPPRTIPHPDTILDIQFSADGKRMAISGIDQGVQVWNTEAATKAARAFYDPFGSVNSLLFSPDSRSIATISTDNTNSVVRVWDWQEALPISQPFQYPTIASGLLFSHDGHKLIFSRPSAAGSNGILFHQVEISPPADLGVDLVSLTESATALRVSKDGIPLICDPFESWSKFRESTPDSWFLQPPASRDVSPAVHTPSLRWVEEEGVTTDELLAAMPAVGLARASVAYWDQNSYNRRMAALKNLASDSAEFAKEEAELQKLGERIDRLLQFAQRNVNNDPQIFLYLSKQAKAVDDLKSAKKLIEQALAVSPDDPKILLQAWMVDDSLADNANALKILKRLREVEPDVFLHRIRLGLALWRTGVRGPAKQEFSAVIDRDDLADFDRAVMLALLDRGDEALPVYQEMAEATKAKSADKKSYTLDGLVYQIAGHQFAGKPDEAIEWYRKLIAAAPGAAVVANLDSAGMTPEHTAVMKKVLAATLAKHPELAPAQESQ